MVKEGSVLGLAGEFRVMSELLLRGHNPAKSYLENGADLILENGLRIEVKTSRKIRRHIGGYQVYSFVLVGKGRRNRQEFVECDFLICWCVDDNWFYIIPSNQIKTILQVPCEPTRESKYSIYKGNWGLLERG